MEMFAVCFCEKGNSASKACNDHGRQKTWFGHVPVKQHASHYSRHMSPKSHLILKGRTPADFPAGPVKSSVKCRRGMRMGMTAREVEKVPTRHLKVLVSLARSNFSNSFAYTFGSSSVQLWGLIRSEAL